MNSLHALALALSLFLLNACSLHGERPAPVGAGIIAVACKNDSAFYLLARERDVHRIGWGHLGGTHEENEPLLATALREFYEESNCSFNLDRPRLLRLTGPSRSGNFSTYHMKVEYLPLSRITQSPVCRTVERDQWVWVRRADLLSALRAAARPATVLVAEGEQRSIRLWDAAANALRQALIDKVIPEENPCLP